LYQKVGYTKVGVIPRFARNVGGALHGAAFYYRELE
jgi:hypothetical protein